MPDFLGTSQNFNLLSKNFLQFRNSKYLRELPLSFLKFPVNFPKNSAEVS